MKAISPPESDELLLVERAAVDVDSPEYVLDVDDVLEGKDTHCHPDSRPGRVTVAVAVTTTSLVEATVTGDKVTVSGGRVTVTKATTVEGGTSKVIVSVRVFTVVVVSVKVKTSAPVVTVNVKVAVWVSRKVSVVVPVASIGLTKAALVAERALVVEAARWWSSDAS